MTAKLHLPHTIAIGGWQLDPRAVREAIAYFKLEWPVEVKLSQGRQRRGAHRAKPLPGWDRGFFHSITVSSFSRPDDAGRTLWHELCHAAQTEYLGAREFAPQYELETRRHGRGRAAYLANRFEVEARAHESFNDTNPLSIQRMPARGGTLRPKVPAGQSVQELIRREAAMVREYAAPRPVTPVRPIVRHDRLRAEEKRLTRQLGQAEKARLQVRKAGRDDTYFDSECKRLAAERKEVRRQIKDGMSLEWK